MYKAMPLSSRVWRRAAPRICVSHRFLSNKAPASTLAQIPTKTASETAAEKPLGLFNVTINNNDAAALFAEKVSQRQPSRTKLALWTDASSVNGEEGPFTWAVVYKGSETDDGTSWKETSGFIPHANPNLAEFHAILRALEIAEMLVGERIASCLKMGARPSRMVVSIFSDNQTALNWASAIVNAEASARSKAMLRLEGPEYCDSFLAANKRLRLSVTSLQLHWVPRRGAEGNIRADKAARRAMEAERKNLENAQWQTGVKAMLPLLRLTGGVVVGSAILLAKFT